MDVPLSKITDWTLNIIVALLNLAVIINICYTFKSSKSVLLIFVLCCVMNEFARFLLVVPHDIITFFDEQAIYPEDSFQYMLSVLIQSVCWFSNLLFLPVFSLLHFLAIYFPLFFRKLYTKTYVFMILVVYIVSLVLAGPLFTSCCGYSYFKNQRTWYFDFNKPYTYIYAILNNILQLFCVIFMIACNIVIIGKLIKIKKYRVTKLTVSPISETGQTSNKKIIKNNKYSKLRNWSQEANLAVRFFILSGCFMIGTMSFNFFPNGELGAYASFVCEALNKAKWIFYWIVSKKMIISNKSGKQFFIYEDNISLSNSQHSHRYSKNHRTRILGKSVLIKNSNTDDLNVFSAFSVNSGDITVVLSSYGYFTQRVFCRYFNNSGKELMDAELSKVFPDFVINCPFNSDAKYISISINEQDIISKENIVEIKRRTKNEHFFSICLAPLFGNDPKWLLLIEFIEYYKLQGATHFYIYKLESDKFIDEILSYYIDKGLIELIELPSSTKCMERHRCRHEMQLQECVVRSRDHSSWIAMIDLDERLHVLNEDTTLEQWIRYNQRDEIAEFRFRCSWVLRYENIPSYQKTRMLEQQLIHELPILKYHNTSHVAPVNHTTKGIVNPKLVNSQGVHQVLSFRNGGQLYMVPPETALVRHFRLQKGWSFFLKEAESFGEFQNTSFPANFENRLINAVMVTIHELIAR